MADTKPTLILTGPSSGPPSAEDIARLWARVTGEKVTPAVVDAIKQDLPVKSPA